MLKQQTACLQKKEKEKEKESFQLLAKRRLLHESKDMKVVYTIKAKKRTKPTTARFKKVPKK